MKLHVCAALKLVSECSTWYRAIRLEHYQSLLSYQHTATIPSRFQAGKVARPGFAAIYFAENHQVALLEAGALIGAPFNGGTLITNPKSRISWIIISVRVKLAGVVDLTHKSIRGKLGTTVQELTGDWQGYALRRPGFQPPPPYFSSAPTQRLGQALFSVPEIEGVISYSAKSPTDRNLVVFPAKLRKGSSLKFQNPIANSIDRIP